MYLKFDGAWPVDYLNVECLIEMDGKVTTNGAAEQEQIVGELNKDTDTSHYSKTNEKSTLQKINDTSLQRT